MLHDLSNKLTLRLAPSKAIDPLTQLPPEIVYRVLGYLKFRDIVYEFCPQRGTFLRVQLYLPRFQGMESIPHKGSDVLETVRVRDTPQVHPARGSEEVLQMLVRPDHSSDHHWETVIWPVRVSSDALLPATAVS